MTLEDITKRLREAGLPERYCVEESDQPEDSEWLVSTGDGMNDFVCYFEDDDSIIDWCESERKAWSADAERRGRLAGMREAAKVVCKICNPDFPGCPECPAYPIYLLIAKLEKEIANG